MAIPARFERATFRCFTVAFLRANLSNLVGKMAIPARFERATFRLGGGPSILLRYGTMLSKVLIFQGFREFGDCSPWRLECLFLIRKGRFLISFSNFGGRTFSHMLISTLLSKGVGVTGKPGHFRTLFPFSVSGKTVVGLLLRRRTLYPAEVRDHVLEILILQGFRAFRSS